MGRVSPSVLIIRLDGIGDALALTPLLAGLRRRAIPVDVLLRPANAGVFASRALREPIVSDVLLRSGTRSNLARIARLGSELSAKGYSHVLVATEDPVGYRLAGAVGAPLRAGFADSLGKPLKALWSRRFLTSTIYRSAGLDRRAPHECESLFALGGSLLSGDAPAREISELRPLVLEREPEPDERVVVQITDKWERLGIAFEHVVAMLRRIAAASTLRLVSARIERGYGDRIADATAMPVEYFDDLARWKEALAAATAIVTPDSGALHVAGMVGTPVVAVFPPVRAYRLQVARWAPWAAPHRIVRAGDGWPIRAESALAELLAL
jgi:ADP-heptose:LPS heptosyltransferase